MSIQRVNDVEGVVLRCKAIRQVNHRGVLSAHNVHLEAHDGRCAVRLPVIRWGMMVMFMMGQRPVRVMVRGQSVCHESQVHSVQLEIAVDASSGPWCTVAAGDAVDVVRAFRGEVTCGSAFDPQLAELRKRHRLQDTEGAEKRRLKLEERRLEKALLQRRQLEIKSSLKSVETGWF